MSGKTYLRKATAANNRLLKAREAAAAALKELEELLDQALIFTTTVSEAVSIYKMTERKHVQTLAWVKAVLLLGSTPQDFPNFLLILECGYSPTQREEEVRQHLIAKRDLLLKNSTIEQLQQLYEKGDWQVQKLARDKIEELVAGVQNLDQLEEWKAEYGHKQFWDSWNYGRAVKRLSVTAEAAE